MASPPSSSHPESAASANPLLALSGTVLEARYELGRVLGAGGMGAVFEATQLRLGRKVAIKVMRPGLAEHEDYIKRFRREARIASEIRHRNVVEVHDFGEAANGLVYCVMELLKGQDLEHLLARQPRNRLPWDRALGLVLQVASGLRAAHAAGIIHRDIKPANCFVVEDDDGEPLVKVLDFGIAKLGDGEDVERISSTSEVFGTPCYMAPELVVSKTPASARTDIYSLGVLAYRMLAGSVPFTGATSFQVLHRACYERAPPLRSHGVEVPRGVEALVMRMLARRRGSGRRTCRRCGG
jgi:serine/threonine protein kinase